MKMPITDTQKILEAISGLGSRMDNLEAGLGGLSSRTDTLEMSLSSRMETLETKLGSRMNTLEAGLGSHMDTLETNLGSRMGTLESRQDEMIDMMQTYATDVDQRFMGVEQRLSGVEKEQARMRSVMVDKDYFDRKLADFKGDIIAILKKGDQRVNVFVNTLKRKRALTLKEGEHILTRSAFIPSRS